MALSEMLHAFCRKLLQCMLTSLLTNNKIIITTNEIKVYEGSYSCLLIAQEFMPRATLIYECENLN